MNNCKLDDIDKQILELQDKLFKYGFQLTLNHNDTNDLLQETTLRILENKEKYTITNNFKGWAFTIMRNIFINNYNRNLRINTHLDVADDEVQQKIDRSESHYPASDLNDIMGILEDSSEEFKAPFKLYIS